MKKSCEFCTDDEEIAYDHMITRNDHPVAEIELTDHKVVCRRLDVSEHEESLELEERGL